MTKHDTREGWLKAAVPLLAEEFADQFPIKMPKKWHVACGFPRGRAEAIGQCWDPEVSADGFTEMFICPSQHEPVRVLDILLHEVGHAVVGVDNRMARNSEPS